MMTNDQFSRSNDLFLYGCSLVNARPTSRQASKFRSGKGRAFQALKSSGRATTLWNELVSFDWDDETHNEHDYENVLTLERLGFAL